MTLIESILNSLPLTPLTFEVNYLVPGYLWIGKPLVTLPHQNCDTDCTKLVKLLANIAAMSSAFLEPMVPEMFINTKYNRDLRGKNIVRGDIVSILVLHYILHC